MWWKCANEYDKSPPRSAWTYAPRCLNDGTALGHGSSSPHGDHITAVPGWTTVVVLVSLLAAVQLIMIGILGEYVGRVYEQVKARPLYVVSDRVNFTEDPAAAAAELRKYPRPVSLVAVAGDDVRVPR